MPFPIKYDICRYRGDDFQGIKFQLFDADANPIDISGSTAKMQLRKSPNSFEAPVQWSTDDGSIEINVNEIYVKEKTGTDMNVEAFKYNYDLQVTYSDGVVVTFINGFFNIQNDVTRN